MAAVALAVALWPQGVGARLAESLYFVALVEVFFCMAQATLTDVATRLRKRPPLWAIVLVGGGLALLYPEVVTVTRAAFAQGWVVFLPFAWSLVERLRELWTMPGAPRLEKLRRRALVSGRMSLVIAVSGAALAAAAVTYWLDAAAGGFAMLGRTAGWWLAAAFAAAAFDVVRVHRSAFERRPRALFGRFDPLGVGDLSPL
jgi:hypothetical protein